jgi:hypothetical protein
MSHQGKFDRELNRLYEERTGRLRRVLKPKRGRIPTLNKKKRESAIIDLQDIASHALARQMAKEEFEHARAEYKTWRPQGWGTDRKVQEFRTWAKDKIDQRVGKVYVFWNSRKCLYVGRTIGRGSRPSQHFRKGWFRATTRIVVYMARRKRDVRRLECLAMHRFLPGKNKIKAAKEKWTPKCPLCRLHRKIKTEIRTIFRLR